MKRFLAALSVLVFVLVATGLASAQSDPRIGTWKLNAAKSKESDPAVARTSETRTYEMSDGAVKAHVQAVMGGSKQEYSFEGTPDGKAHPYTGYKPGGAETTTIKRKGSEFTAESRKGSKALFTTTSTFSPDGKVMTMTNKGLDSNGKSVNSVRVYEKQ